MIKLSGVKKIYQSQEGEVVAVDNVNVNIAKGEIFGIIGYSGAGKSTLIRLLNQLEAATEGTITINNYNMNSIKGDELRKSRQEISMIFQHFNLLWSRTVRENISFPLEIAGIRKKERLKRVDELIKLVGLEGRENAYPSQLSGGQKQRVGIARALANRPKVLLCDEATSALDPQTTDSILELLVDINKKLGLTIVLITHEMHVIRKICHRVAVMENGSIVEQGEVLSVFQQPKASITKKFVKQITEPEEATETIEHILESYPEGKVIKLLFVGDDAEQPLIAELIRQFKIGINIIQGKISHTQHGAYGTLFIHMTGTAEEINRSITYIKEKHVAVEVIQHG
ncbi:methionine ABC transporter ATP-binding protein [Cytobacillus sp. Hm23]